MPSLLILPIISHKNSKRSLPYFHEGGRLGNILNGCLKSHLSSQKWIVMTFPIFHLILKETIFLTFKILFHREDLGGGAREHINSSNEVKMYICLLFHVSCSIPFSHKKFSIFGLSKEPYQMSLYF